MGAGDRFSYFSTDIYHPSTCLIWVSETQITVVSPSKSLTKPLLCPNIKASRV